MCRFWRKPQPDNDVTTHNADGALMFCTMYWKQRFNYEIKFHCSLDDIHDDIDHCYALCCGSEQFLLVEKIEGPTLCKIKLPWPLHTSGFVDIFPNSCLAKVVLRFYFQQEYYLQCSVGGGGGTSSFLPWGSISVTKCDEDTAFKPGEIAVHFG